MLLSDLPAWAAGMLDRERVGRLAFRDGEGLPRVLPVTFALADGCVWSAIDRKPKRSEPARVRWLARRPDAAFLVDVYDDDWSRLAWVQLLGRVEIGATVAAPAAMAALAARYPAYRETPPPGPLLRLAPERALCWRAGDG